MKKAVVLLLVICPIILMGYTELTGDISGMVLIPGTYLVGQCTVAAGTTLEVQAGAVLKFNYGQSFINVYGTIDVNGSSGNYAFFLSKNDDSEGEIIAGSNGNPQSGDWECVTISGGVGQFDYAIFRFGGATSNGGYTNLNFLNSATGWFRQGRSEYAQNNGIRVIDSDVEISWNELNTNGTYGVYVKDSTVDINNCSFNTNVGYAVYLNGDVDFTQFYDNIFNNNGVDGIFVYGNIAEDMIWPANTNYNVIVGSVIVDAGVTCTIPAGRIIKFADGQTRLKFNGTLDVNGTSSQPVIFTSLKDDTYGGDTNNDGNATTPAPGDWLGVEASSNSSIAEFDYCRVRYGGYGANGTGQNVNFVSCNSGSFTNSISEFSLGDGLEAFASTVTIDSSTFENNASYGVRSYYYSDVDIDNSSFNSNGYYAAYLDGTIRGYSNNTASGNGTDAFGIEGVVSENIIWGSSLTSVLTGTITINDDIICTIPEGTIIKANSDGQFTVNGTLDVNGTSGNPVIFTSEFDDIYGGDTNNDGSATSPAPGDWRGITLFGYEADDGVGEIDYCRVRYGGRHTGSNANINYFYSDSGYFNNSFCEYSSQDGIKAYNCEIDISGSTFENNTSYAAYLEEITVKGYPNNSATGNGVNAFGLSGNVTENITWASSLTSVVISLIGQIEISDNIICTLPTGTVIKSNSDGNFEVLGTMDVNGTETDPVVFTSLQDDTYGGDTNNDGNATSPAPGDWDGIHLNGYVDSDGIGEFDYCRVRYGGKYTGSDANIYYYYSDSGYFNNSFCEYSSQEGLKIYESSPLFRNSTFENNISYGVHISGSSNPDFGTNSRSLGLNEFINNDSGNIQFYNASTNAINAYHNEWGYYDAVSIDAHIYDDDENGSFGEVLFDPWFVESVEITLMTADPLDFAMLYYGLDKTLPVVIQNDGTVDLIVSDVSIGSQTDVFEFVYDDLNVPIAPGEKDTIFVTFTPDAEDSFTETLSITNNSSNQPLLEVTLQGNGEYDEIPAPQNVTIILSNGDATISWDAVTETVHGIPIIPDFYVINYSETVEEDPEAYYHLVMTDQTSFVHVGVDYFADQMFYQVIAIRDYEGQYTARDNYKNEENRKITWGEFKNLNNIK